MTDLRALLAPIRSRLAAATPGPWHWRNTQDVYLMGAKTRIVMGFTRMGMQGAQPQFVNDDGVFIDAGKENLHVIPDAALIANAPTDLARLLAAIEAVASVADDLDASASKSSYKDNEAVTAAWLESATMIRTALAAALGSDTTNQEGTK